MLNMAIVLGVGADQRHLIVAWHARTSTSQSHGQCKYKRTGELQKTAPKKTLAKPHHCHHHGSFMHIIHHIYINVSGTKILSDAPTRNTLSNVRSNHQQELENHHQRQQHYQYQNSPKAVECGATPEDDRASILFDECFCHPGWKGENCSTLPTTTTILLLAKPTTISMFLSSRLRRRSSIARTLEGGSGPRG